MMKTTNRLAKVSSMIVAGAMATALVAGGFLFAPGTPALAAQVTPPASKAAANIGKNLPQLLQRENNWLILQNDHLTIANDVAKMMQDWINNVSSQGKDVTGLQTALAAFNAQIATAQTAHSTAASLLSAHAGFDANNVVTDATQARQTIHDVRKALADSNMALRQARRDLHNAIMQWREANHPSK